MIDIFHASNTLLACLSQAKNERELIRDAITSLGDYYHVTCVKHSELDIAFAATGGPSEWVNVGNMSVGFSPLPERQSCYGDILVERSWGYVNLSTPAGFIPLVDVIERQGQLQRKCLN